MTVYDRRLECEMKILIIDDDVVDRQRIRRFIKDTTAHFDCELIEATDGEAGLGMIESGDFDCVLLDYSLPGTDGLSVLRKMMTMSETPPPVIMQTALDDELASLAFLEAGAQDYLVKGEFDSRSLIRAIRYACERQKLIRQKNTLVRELQAALARVHRLEGILPICSICKQIRDKNGDWHIVEEYVTNHSQAEFSHSLCPICAEKFMEEEL